MKNLNRALRKSLKYKWSILGSLLCSVLVALCWGANLGGVYPFVEVVLHNKTILQWAEDRITESQQAIDRLDTQIVSLEQPMAATALAPMATMKGGSTKLAEPSAAAASSSDATLSPEARDKKLRGARAERELHERRIASTEQWLPWIRQYLPNDAYKTLVLIIVILLVATVLRGIFLMGSMVLVARVGQRTILDLQNDVFRNVLNMELSELGVKGTGDLISRIRGETNAIGTAITNLFGKTLREPLKMAACLAGAAYFNWRLLLFSLLVTPIAVAFMLILARSTKRANKRAMEEAAKLLNRLYQALTYMRVVKAFTMENHERSRFQVVARDVYGRSMKIAWYSAFARINNELLGISIIGLAVLAGGYLVMNNETHLFGIRLASTAMSMGEVMAFFALLCGVADPLRKMADVYGSLQSGMVAADRVYPLIDQQPAIQSPSNPVAFPTEMVSIDIKDLQYSYDPERPILRGLSFQVPAGTSLAIIGPNGCGKSTLINLLPRFFDPESGTIAFNGTDVRQFNVKHLRRHVGYVTQLTMLFSDTVENNIRYGQPNASRLEVVAAAKKAYADSFINELEGDYDADIGEHGGKLSGGQRQRLTLARAILKNPPLLLLDEATSQIDPQSEILIHQALAEFMKGRTSIIVTHRLSTLELVDRIMVMDQGQIVDIGTHAELMRRCDTYRMLRETELKEVA